jgi:hypothetical protein
MKKFFPFAIMLLCVLYPLSAQKPTDIIYLKNGNQIYGKLLEINDNQFKIQTTGGTITYISGTEVNKFVKDLSGSDTLYKAKQGIALEAGVLTGAQSSKYDAAFSFNLIWIMKRGKLDSFGLGSGVEYLGQPFMPLFLEYKHLISEKRTSPFIFMRGGGLIHINGDFERTDQSTPEYNTPYAYAGGFSLTLGLGISWIKDNYESYLSFAYRNAHTSYNELVYTNVVYTYKNVYNRLEIKYGFRF